MVPVNMSLVPETPAIFTRKTMSFLIINPLGGLQMHEHRSNPFSRVLAVHEIDQSIGDFERRGKFRAEGDLSQQDPLTEFLQYHPVANFAFSDFYVTHVGINKIRNSGGGGGP